MGRNTAPQRPTAVVGETNLVSVSFDDVLDSSESLTGTVAVVESTTTDLTITNIAGTANQGTVSSATLTINGESVTAARAVQFKESGHLVANAPYKVKITATTNSTPAQTKVKYITFDVEA